MLPAKLILLGTMLGSAFAAPLAAQVPSGGPRLQAIIQPTRPLAYAITATPSDTTGPPRRHYSPNFWVEGGTFGAVIFSTTGGYIGYSFCDSDSGCSDRTVSTLEGSLGGAAVGFGLGALVGGMFPATHGHPLRGHPGRGLLVGTIVGGVWSFGVVAGLCANGCATWEVNYGIMMTTLSGVAGLLLGLGTPEPVGR